MKSKILIGLLGFAYIALLMFNGFLLHITDRLQHQIDARDSLIEGQFDNVDTYDEHVDSLCAS